MLRKTTQLKNLLQSEKLEFLMEAHNGLSAKIVEEAGFKGIWGSGLSISAAMGVRDNNEASWTQILEILEFMSDATSIPILLDGDTGYGNFNNLRRLVKKLEQRGVAGVCIEDKQFPKKNSFIDGHTQPLADIEEFCGKIKAAKDAQKDNDFVVISRVEAFIAGWGLSEALKRAEAYHHSGADGILIHSSLRVPDEILAFKQEWGDRCPVIIVPTKYYTTPTQVFRDYKFSIAIWANQTLRAAITEMQKIVNKLSRQENLLDAEESIIPVSEVFRLQGCLELQEAEKLYLPQNNQKIASLLLAASRGIELGTFTKEKPKCMLTLKRKPILGQIIAIHHEIGIKNISVVRGYKKEAINLANIKYVDNDEYESTGEIFSLYLGLKKIIQDNENQDLVIGYGDVLLKKYILQLLLENDYDLAVIVDSNWHKCSNQVRADYTNCSVPNSKRAFYQDVGLHQIDANMPEEKICGMWTGLLKVSSNVQRPLLDALEKLLLQLEIKSSGRMPNLINELIALGYPVNVVYITGDWLDVDEVEDMIKAGSF